MTGLVEQLQSDAIDPAVPVSTLLRKVKVAAVKLGLNDALEWVEHELGGYQSDLPAYRQGRGSTVGFNPYHGWQPVHFRDASAADIVSTVNFHEPIANYEALLDKDGPFTLPIPNHLVSKLNETFKFDVPRMANEVPRGLIVQVVQHVRDMVLDWALELARAGVTGDGLGFSNDERARANSAHISIGTFQGSFNTGSVNGENARINQASSDQSTNVVSSGNVFSEVRSALQSAGLPPERMIEVDTRLVEMSVAKDKTSFVKAYQAFVGAVADHITVVAPFLPQITELLSKLV